jgi:hypothetical protein
MPCATASLSAGGLGLGGGHAARERSVPQARAAHSASAPALHDPAGGLAPVADGGERTPSLRAGGSAPLAPPPPQVEVQRPSPSPQRRDPSPQRRGMRRIGSFPKFDSFEQTNPLPQPSPQRRGLSPQRRGTRRIGSFPKFDSFEQMNPLPDIRAPHHPR